MTYFRAIRTIIGPKCLTAVFGMGTGVATWVWSPESLGKEEFGRIKKNHLSWFILHPSAFIPAIYQKGSGRRDSSFGSTEPEWPANGGHPHGASRRESMRSSGWLLVPVR